MCQRLKKSLNTILILFSLLGSASALAAQLVEGSERKHVEVNVSAHEQNRLAIAGSRISSIVPSQKGAIVYVKDEVAGALYFSFPKGEFQSGTVTLFVTDEKAPAVTYKLILVPKPIAGEEVIIKPVKYKSTTQQKKGSDGRAFAYQRRAKNLMLSMMEAGAEPIPINQIVPLWKEGRLVLLSKYVEGDMVGEKYRLTNITDDDMVLVEQELYRHGVIAVAIDNHTLPANDQTLIYIVRGRKDNE